MDSETLDTLDDLVLETVRETLIRRAKELGFDVRLKEFDISLSITDNGQSFDVRFRGDDQEAEFGLM